MDAADPKQYLEDADLIYSAQAVQHAITAIAGQLNQDYTAEAPIVLSVMGGAVVFAGQLIPQLNFALEFDYVQATRYHGTAANAQITWVIRPKANIKNRDILILDDILDEGVTLQAIVNECKLLGAKAVKTAVLFNKQLNKNKPILADYVGLEVPNRYVFGCGMDIYGWWRNLPGIYALKNH